MIIRGNSLSHADFANYFTCFRGRCLRSTSVHHQPASLEAKCCANYCMTLPSISVLMEIHNLWHILVSASGDLNAIIPLKWDLIGQLLSRLLLWSYFFKCSQIVAIMYHRPAEQTSGEPEQHQLSFSQNGIGAVKFCQKITALDCFCWDIWNHISVCQLLHHYIFLCSIYYADTPPRKIYINCSCAVDFFQSDKKTHSHILKSPTQSRGLH